MVGSEAAWHRKTNLLIIDDRHISVSTWSLHHAISGKRLDVRVVLAQLEQTPINTISAEASLIFFMAVNERRLFDS
jgi:hypothetical protein